MATYSKSKLYLLMGFDAVFDRPYIEFVNSLPATVPVCVFCRAVPSEHYKLSCKHVFCGACLDDVVKPLLPSLLCPVGCKSMPTNNAALKQTTNFETVSRLPVLCWNKRRGCPYTGELADLRRHFLGCDLYEVSCSLCSQTMPRSNLAAHFGAVHRKRRRSARHGAAAGEESDGQSSAELTHDEDSDDGVKRAYLPGLNKGVKKAVKASASRMTEDLKQHSEALFLEFFSGIELVKDHLVAFADAAKFALPAKAATEREPATSRPGREVPVKDYTWVVGPYSRLRDGTHPVDSLVFLIAPGYKVQLQACIGGTATLELTASVKVHRTDASDVPRAGQVPWPFRRTCQFTLFSNSADQGHVTKSFAACDAFNGPTASSSSSHDETLVSGRLEIGKMEKSVFESHYLKDDAFTIGFTTLSLLE